jgi:hypothetical protein
MPVIDGVVALYEFQGEEVEGGGLEEDKRMGVGDKGTNRRPRPK